MAVTFTLVACSDRPTLTDPDLRPAHAGARSDREVLGRERGAILEGGRDDAGSEVPPDRAGDRPPAGAHKHGGVRWPRGLPRGQVLLLAPPPDHGRPGHYASDPIELPVVPVEPRGPLVRHREGFSVRASRPSGIDWTHWRRRRRFARSTGGFTTASMLTRDSCSGGRLQRGRSAHDVNGHAPFVCSDAGRGRYPCRRIAHPSTGSLQLTHAATACGGSRSR